MGITACSIPLVLFVVHYHDALSISFVTIFIKISFEYLKLKVLDRLFLRGIFGPYLLSFFVVEFVLVMQFLWKEIDDLLGKGYALMDYVQLIGYFSMAMIPMALPLTVLLSSVMVYGDMAEKYELTAMKSSGISLMRMLRPGLIIALLTMSFSFFSSNVLKPRAFDGYFSKMRAMKTNQLTFDFDEKVFNTSFENYSIWIDKKHDDGRTLEGIKIYDHSDQDKSVTNYIHAKSGEMYTTADQKYLIMQLYDGQSFKELRSELATKNGSNYNLKARPVNRVQFKELRKHFDINELINLSAISMGGREYDTMNALQLSNAVDSLHTEADSILQRGVYRFNELRGEEAHLKKTERPKDKVKKRLGKPTVLKKEVKKQIAILDIPLDKLSQSESAAKEHILPNRSQKLYERAESAARSARDRAHNQSHEVRSKHRNANTFALRLHQQFSWAIVCLLFLFIGGPAGAIVRKGGFGLPLLVAIVFYMTFIMTSITGEKLLRSAATGPVTASWLPCFILLPFAILLTYYALHDKNVSK